MLKAVLETLEGVDESLAAHYTEKDGKFYLAVEKMDGLSLENVDGLKTTVEKLRQTEKTLKAEKKSLEETLASTQAAYEGVDPDAAREALSKIDEIKNWDGETKVKVAVERTQSQMQSKLDELVKKHTEQVEGLQIEISTTQEQLKDAIVTSKIMEAITTEGGNAELLMPHVRSQVRMAKDSAGRFKPEVLNSEGVPRIGDNDGRDMTILQLLQEMKSKPSFAPAFPGTGSTGGNNNNNPKPPKTGNKPKVISSTDTKAMGANLEDIATGKVAVDMSVPQE